MKIVARILSLVLVCSMLCGTVYAEDSENAQASVTGEQAFETLKSYGIADDSLHNNVMVNRADCVIAIMKIIGMSAEREAHVGRSYYQPVFDDEGYDGYVYEAAGVIAIGDGNRNFFPDRDVTVKEVAAFMVRCLVRLGDSGDERMSVGLDDTFAKAKDLGIIQEADTFYNDSDATLTPNEFCVLLNRMLYQKRYMYYDYDNKFNIQFDTSGSGRYIDYLKKVEK